MHKFVYTIILSLFLLAALAGCSASEKELSFAPAADLPDHIQQAPQIVRESYQFAAANPDLLTQIPCYCGCEPMGHTSNYRCYVESVNQGETIFDDHALGCSICVDITVDSIKMVKEGMSTSEIRQAIDLKYAQFGPSNMEPILP